MNKVFNEIFEELQDNLKNNLEHFEQSSEPAPELNSSGSKTFDFDLDGNGHCGQSFDQYGAGVTVKFTLTPLGPEGATYTEISIKCSTGGGGTWHNVKVGTSISGELKTSFWRKSHASVDVICTAKNQKGAAKLDYSY